MIFGYHHSWFNLALWSILTEFMLSNIYLFLHLSLSLPLCVNLKTYHYVGNWWIVKRGGDLKVNTLNSIDVVMPSLGSEGVKLQWNTIMKNSRKMNSSSMVSLTRNYITGRLFIRWLQLCVLYIPYDVGCIWQVSHPKQKIAGLSFSLKGYLFIILF